MNKNRIKVTRTIEINRNDLFDKKIDDVIDFLLKIKKENTDKELKLQEEWSGYEDNYFVFSYEEYEDDEEYDIRIESIEKQEREQLEKKRKDKLLKEKREQIKKIEEEISRIK